MKIYYINLDESVERRKLMEQGLTTNEFQYKRIPGIKHNISHIGCCLSHIQAILNAYLDGNEYAAQENGR